MGEPTRRSDRWLTPAVVVALVLGGVVVVLGVLVAVTYVTVRGFDPQPVVQLAGTLVAAASALGTFIVQLVSRRTVTSVERQAGRLATGVHGVLEELDATRGRHAGGEWEEDLDDGTAPHARGGLTAKSAHPRGPGGGPSDVSERYADAPDEDLRHTEWYRA